MNQPSEEQIFGQYVDDMLKFLQSEKFDRKALRTSILTDLLANRHAILKKDSYSLPNHSTPVPPKRIPLEIDEAAIRAKAEEIAAWHNSYDTLIWLWAKSSLEVKSGVESTAEMIIPIAELYALTEKDIHKIHWYLAENLLKLRKKSK